jgi:EAL and modified HD-GYP domain-containing signal transduction protein
MSMESALVNLSLPANINDALLHRGGPLAPFLELTLACESGDCTELARLASALSLDGNEVNRAHLQALSWAETLGD